MLRNEEILELECFAISMTSGIHVEGNVAADTCTSDFGSVEIGDESIVVFHLQRHSFDRVGIFDIKRNAQINRSTSSTAL